MTIRAYGYVRLSKDAPDSLSVESQRRAIKRRCADRGWTIVDWFEDVDESAFNGRRRPAMARMLERLDDAKVIVFRDIDRFSRTPSEGLAAAERCKQAGVQLVSCSQGEIDTTSAEGEFQYTMFLALARMEVKRTQARVNAAFATKRTNDEPIGPPAYGWRWKDKRHVPDPRQLAVLREAARRFVRGQTYSEIADALSDRYVASLPKGEDGRRRMFMKGAVPRLHVAALSRMLASFKVQEALGDLGDDLATAIRSRRQTRTPNSNASLLGGIARCGVCGGGMRRSSTRADRPGRWFSYRCPTPGHAGIAAPWLEEHVSSAVLGAIDLGKLARTAKQRQRQPAAVEVAALEARIEEFEDMLGDGTLTKAAFVRQRDRLRAKMAQAREAVADEAVADLPLRLVRGLPGSWSELETTERRDVIRAMLREVVVTKAATNTGPTPDRVRLVWR
jgi:site-specific DNA recombinase